MASKFKVGIFEGVLARVGQWIAGRIERHFVDGLPKGYKLVFQLSDPEKKMYIHNTVEYNDILSTGSPRDISFSSSSRTL